MGSQGVGATIPARADRDPHGTVRRIFTSGDLLELGDHVAAAWLAGADRDWSAPAGTLDWSCTATADHAVDCVFAPATFLASRRTDAYPDVGIYSVGPDPRPAQLVEAVGVMARLLVATVADAEAEGGVRAVLFSGPILGEPADFLPRGALELILHAHDVCAGLGVPFEPPPGLCERLREHTRPWALWTRHWDGLPSTGDPWADLLAGSGRARAT
jgi:hypothetical protein